MNFEKSVTKSYSEKVALVALTMLRGMVDAGCEMVDYEWGALAVGSGFQTKVRGVELLGLSFDGGFPDGRIVMLLKYGNWPLERTPIFEDEKQLRNADLIRIAAGVSPMISKANPRFSYRLTHMNAGE